MKVFKITLKKTIFTIIGRKQIITHVFEYVFEDLNKYSKYSFYLYQDFNKIKSNIVSFQTPSDVPDGPPENLKIDIINASSIKLTWSLPPIEKCNGIIKGYKISIKENDKKLVSLVVDSKPQYKIINNLNSGKIFIDLV